MGEGRGGPKTEKEGAPILFHFGPFLDLETRQGGYPTKAKHVDKKKGNINKQNRKPNTANLHKTQHTHTHAHTHALTHAHTTHTNTSAIIWPNSVLAKTRFWPKLGFGPNSVLAQTRFWPKLGFGPNSVWAKTRFGPKLGFGQSRFWPRIGFGQSRPSNLIASKISSGTSALDKAVATSTQAVVAMGQWSRTRKCSAIT